MYTQTPFVHTKQSKMPKINPKTIKITDFSSILCVQNPYLCVQILPTFWGKLGQKVGKVATKCTHKPHLYTQKLTFFQIICVYKNTFPGRSPLFEIQNGQHVHTNHHVLSSFCVYKTRLYNMVKPSRNISL